ncbi:MAG: hypothetical protein AW07_04229 [Candidatus Accumulibacter sp. SK-11]|nr:MAG: hypothetical protein AW07_04229 [Candidatus Accumulibacter sp. SK-11]
MPEIMLMIDPGTKNGEILRTPPATKSSQVFSITGRPPIPEPIDTPTRSGTTWLPSSPASRMAWMPAAMP